LTLAATAGVDRGWIVGTSVLLSASTVTNTMTGVVVSYTASTQVLVVNVASVVGSGTYSTWQVSNLMPRFDYNPSTLAAQGLLIEESRANSLWYSEEFGNIAGWATTGTAPTITTNSTTSPSGTLTADTITFAAADSRIQNEALLSFTAGLSYTITLYAKAVGTSLNKIRLALFDGTQQNSSDFTVSNTAWTRLTVTFVAANTTAVGRMQIRNATDNLANSLYIWGAQLEAGSFATSYIPTTTTALTRAADVASVNTLSPWYNASAGTVYAEATGPIANIYRILAEGASAADFRDFSLSFDGLRGNFTSRFVTGNFDVLGPANSLTAGATVKLAGSYSSTSADLAYGGTLAVTKNAVTQRIPADRIFLGSRLGTSLQLNGHLRRLTYYPRTLSTAELQAITA
jgi:hypothetical protein